MRIVDRIIRFTKLLVPMSPPTVTLQGNNFLGSFSLSEPRVHLDLTNLAVVVFTVVQLIYSVVFLLYRK